MPNTSRTQDIAIPVPDYTIPLENPKVMPVQKQLTERFYRM